MNRYMTPALVPIRTTVLTIIAMIFAMDYSSSCLLGQSLAEIDSIEKVIITQDNDTNKINNLVIVTKGYIYRDLNKVESLIDDILLLSQNLKFYPGIADYYYLKSILYKNNLNYDSSLILLNNALALIDSVNDFRRLANYYRLYAMTLHKQGLNITASVYYKRSLMLYEDLNDQEGITKTYNSLGIIYDDAMKYDSALHYYFKSLSLAEKNMDFQNQMPPCINIGRIFNDMKDAEKAIEFFNKCLDISTRQKNISFIGQSYNNLGMVFHNLNKFEEALKNYGIAIENFNSIDAIRDKATTLINMGNVYRALGDKTNALKKYHESLAIYKSHGIIHGIIDAEIHIALYYEDIGNYTRTLQIYDSCLTLAKESNYLEIMPILYNNIYKDYELAGNWSQAFHYQSLHTALKDSIYTLEKERIINDLELNYEKEKNEAQILLLQNDNLQKDIALKKRTIQRNIYIFIALIIVISGLLSFGLFYTRSRKNKIIMEQKLRQLEDEKKLLAAQSIVEGQEQERKRIAYDLHDGIGILLSSARLQFSSIIEKVPKHKELLDRANKLIEQAATDIRKISHNMMPGILTKFGLLEAAESLFDQFEDSPDISATVNITGNPVRLTENTEIMLYRIVQELLNNTIKHASAQNIVLHFHFTDKLQIQYSDDGRGFNVDEKMGSGTFGLKSIQSRVNFLSGELTFESKPGKGFTCFIHVPIQNQIAEVN
jgi:signal transduction histidine kinase